MIKGDLTKFSPGDLLTFLSHLNQEGVLTVNHGDTGLCIYFQNGFLVAAHSEQSDAKVLGSLRASGIISGGQFSDIQRARQETGLPLRQILRDFETIDLAAAEPMMKMGIHEVLFQLFTWETGSFQFNEASLEDSFDGQIFDSTGLTLDAARQVDEYKEFFRNIPSEDLVLHKTEAGKTNPQCADEIRFVLHLANGNHSVLHIIQEGPFTSFSIMKAIEDALKNQWVVLQPNKGPLQKPTPEPAAAEGALFLSYKRSTLKVIQAKGRQQQISELISYCRDHFDYFILFFFSGEKVVRSLRFQRDDEGRRLGVELPKPDLGLESDPTFRFVCESHTPFFGKTFPSALLEGLGEPDPSGECAIIPLGGQGEESYLLYACSDGEDQFPGPMHYLEMISWHIHTPNKNKQPQDPPQANAQPKSPNAAQLMVAAVNELPPMPHVVTEVMKLLSDKDSQMSDMVKLLSRDPALVVRIIRASNSALYSRGKETTSLGQAVVRLGAKTVRSLVMATSMRDMFPMDKTNIGVWGQAIWQHSIECGLASRYVAQVIGYPDPEEAFAAGVLHDVGKLVILLHKPDEFRHILKRQAAARESFTAAEVAIMGFSHSELGKRLLEKWNMPQNLQNCAQYHHHPSEAGGDTRLVRIVALGNFLSHAFGSQPDAQLADHACDFEGACAELGLSFESSQELLDKIGSYLENSDFLN